MVDRTRSSDRHGAGHRRPDWGVELHGDRGALRFNFERLNELDFYDLGNDAAVQGWTTIDVTRAGAGHPYVDAWWPDSHGLGYEHAFVNQASDILTVIGGTAAAYVITFYMPTYAIRELGMAPPVALFGAEHAV